MLRPWFLSFSLIFAGVSVYASNQQRAYLEQFKSSRLSFPSEEDSILKNSPGRYPEPWNFLMASLLSWTPTGRSELKSESCRPELWGERLRDPRVATSVQAQGALVQKYFQECRQELETGENSYFVNMRKMMTMRYEPQDHPFLRRIVVNLPGNIKLKGLLGLKGDLKRRPMVIVRLGIFSSVEDFMPERAWMMMLFEQSPFNILLLENMSSSDFVSNNNSFSFGGYDEGIQNIQIARLLKDPTEPLSQIVDSVHLFGISLGGHGVLFSSLLNKYNSSKNQPLIRSFTALCPVVNLQPTMRSLTESGVMAAFVDLWSRQRLKGIDTKIPALASFDNFSFLNKTISEVARTYHGGLSYVSSVKLPPGMKDGANFWELNDFWKFYKNVKEPVLIYATEQDPAVPYAKNSQMILNRNLKVDSKNIRVVELSQGVHCTLPVPYDWKVLSSIFQSYILSHSPNFHTKINSLDVDLSDEEWKGFFSGSSKVDYEVGELSEDAGFVKLEMTVQNGQGDRKTLNMSLPLAQFDFRFHNAKLTRAEQEMLVRWIYQNVRAEIDHSKNKSVLRITWAVAP